MTRRGEVKLAGVGKSFGDTSVLRDVDLEIRPGEFFSLLGPSGSGKTTTLRIIAGLETATHGFVYSRRRRRDARSRRATATSRWCSRATRSIRT